MQVSVKTHSKTELIDITASVQDAVTASGVEKGLCLVFVPHTTAAVTINESADPSVKADVLKVLNQVIPWEAGYRHLEGQGITVRALPRPAGTGQVRKLLLPLWLARYAAHLWRSARNADAVHAVLLGDIGTLGLVAALALDKPLFARHCGMWTYSDTLAARLTKA